MLTIPPSVGYDQNTLSIYYCYDVEGSTRTLKKCIAEILRLQVTNTPWGERVTFLFNPNTEKSSFFEDYAIAAGVAWQIKDLLLSETTRNTLLGSGILERAYFALKVISEASILHSIEYDYFDLSPISAYTTLALHMSLHNMKLDGGKTSVQATISDLTIDHLLHCTYKVFRANDSKESGKLPSESLNIAPECRTNSGESQTGAHLTKQTNITRSVKMLTSVLKFIVEATAMDLVPNSQDRCLNFSREMLKFITTKLKDQSISQLDFPEHDLKDIFNYVKSSLTYSAKFLFV